MRKQMIIVSLISSHMTLLSYAAVNKNGASKELKISNVEGVELGLSAEESLKPEIQYIKDFQTKNVEKNDEKKKYKSQLKQAQLLKINEIDSYFSAVEIKLPSVINIEKIKKDKQILESYTVPGGKGYYNLAVKTDLSLEKDKLIYTENSWDYGSETRAYDKAVAKTPRKMVAEFQIKPHSEGLMVDQIHIYDQGQEETDGNTYNLTIKLETPLVINATNDLLKKN